MNRREWLARASCLAGSVFADKFMYPLSSLSAQDHPVQVSVNEDKLLGAIPPDFVGLGYEISSVATPGLMSATNRVYAQMLRTLGSAGVIRVGGNTADYSSYSASGTAVSAPKQTVVNSESLRQLGSFLDATGWSLVWSLNLGESTEREAVEEAQAVSAVAAGKLLAFEIGNEVDLFVREGHRKKDYTFDDYLGEYRRYKAAIRATLPDAPFAGPDVAGQTDWVSRFSVAEQHDLKLLTEHYYRAGQSSTSSLEMLLNTDAKLVPMLETLQRVSTRAAVPYRICETNSFSGGGKPGVSDTFGAALWVLDYMFTLASYDAAGVNMETGVNQIGFISSYSPIGDDERGAYTAMPEYYGMLAFAQASKGQRVGVKLQAGGINFSSYAVVMNRRVVLTLINKDRTRQASVDIKCNARVTKATAMRLKAPTLESLTGVTLGGSYVTPDGRWKPLPSETLRVSSEGARILVPAGSAALVALML